MKSWHYIAILISIVVIMCGLVLYNASTIDDIKSDSATIGKAKAEERDEHAVVKQDESAAVKQEKIDVLNSVDFENDVFDGEMIDDLSDIEKVDDIFNEEDISF